MGSERDAKRGLAENKKRNPNSGSSFKNFGTRLHPDFLYFYSLKKAIFKIG